MILLSKEFEASKSVMAEADTIRANKLDNIECHASTNLKSFALVVYPVNAVLLNFSKD